MGAMIALLSVPLGYLMNFCYQACANYNFAIIVFAFLTKIILLPISIWVHKNTIKIVQIQPEINFMKAKFFGDLDRIASEQAHIFKRAKYNPLASLIPLAIQIILLIGVIDVIYHPLNHLLRLPEDLISVLVSVTGNLVGADKTASSIQFSVIEAVRSGQFAQAFASVSSQFPSLDIPTVLSSIASLQTDFLGLDISWIPSMKGGIMILSPLMAGLSSLLLCLLQNHANVLQSEQGKLNHYGTVALSVGLSLYLGWFVPIGIALYWIIGNLYGVFQLLILNRVIHPQKYVNFAELEKSKKALANLENVGGKQKRFAHDASAKREKADYKRFFSVENKHLVFYSEKSGFYKYFENIIEELLKRSNIIIHYVTSDPDDAIFEKANQQPRIKPYYIGEKRLITLMLMMDADMVVMTMSDLGNYHIKRSYVRKDVEYVYLFHYPLSTHMVLHTGALDHYDTILCVGEFQFSEIRKTESIYKLPAKKLIPCGYGQLEKLYAGYEKMEKVDRTRRKVLIAPSWQADNILDSCIDKLLGELLGKGFEVVVRPHPEYVKRYRPKMDSLVACYADYGGDNLAFELDFSQNASIFDSDVVITDWSGTAYEFAFVTCKPVVFIDTKPKVHNEEYGKLGIEPLEFALRDKIGIRVAPAALDGLSDKLERLFTEASEYRTTIHALREKYITNFGHSGEVGCRYILDSLKARSALKSSSKMLEAKYR